MTHPQKSFEPRARAVLFAWLISALAAIASAAAGAARPAAADGLDGTWFELGAPVSASVMLWDSLEHRLVSSGRHLLRSGDGWAIAWELRDHSGWVPLRVPVPPFAGGDRPCCLLEDPARRRFVLLAYPPGEFDHVRLWALELAPEPHWRLLDTDSAGPSGRPLASLATGAVWLESWASPTELWTRSLADTGRWRRLRAVSGFLYRYPRLVDVPRNRELGVRWSADSAQVWTQSLSGTDGLTIAPTSGRPPARPVRIAVPDPARDRLLVFFEDDPNPGLPLETHPEVWALGLAEPMRWEDLGATDYSCASVTFTTSDDSLFLNGSGGPPWRPGVRTISAPLSDPTHARIVSDQAWPPTSMGAVLVRDASRQRWLLVGGRPDYAHLGGSLDSLWELRLSGDLAAWRHLAVEGRGPVPSGHYACAVDESDGTLYVLNGWDQATGTPTGPRELWALRSASPPRWELVHSAAAGDWPLLYEAPAFVFDPVHRRLTAFSVQFGVPAISASAIWEFAVDAPPSWTLTVAQGTPPTFFQGGTAAFDAAASRVMMLADNGQIAILETEPVLRWELTHCLNPASGGCLGVRMGMRGVFDPIGRRLLEMGGFDPFWDGIGTEDALFEIPAGDSLGPARRLWPEGSQGWQGVPTYAYDGERDALLVFGDRSTFGPGLQELRFDRSGRAVATPGACAALGDRNALRWAATPSATFRLWRLAPGEPWAFLAELRAPASGDLTFDDRAIEAGARYGYRITSGSDAESPAGADVWLATPTSGVFALAQPWPNPSRGALNVAFTLGVTGPAELELFDIAGRRLWARRLDTLTPGPHHVAVSAGETPRTGLYLLRLKQAGLTATRRVVLAR